MFGKDKNGGAKADDKSPAKGGDADSQADAKTTETSATDTADKKNAGDKPDAGGKDKKVKVLRVRSKSKAFRRAGLAFTEHEQVLRVSKLKKEQIEALKSEKELVVTEDEVAASEVTG